MKLKHAVAVRAEVPNVDIPSNSSVDVGIINDMIIFPTGYTIEGLTLMSSSIGYCIPYIRYSESVLRIAARNFNTQPINVTIYVRAIFIRIQ